MKKGLFILLGLLLATIAQGQKLTHQLGEVIVEVADERHLEALVKEMSSAYRNDDIKVKHLTQEPMITYLISCDPGKVNEEDFLHKVIMSRHTLSAQKNRLVTYREKPDDPKYIDQWQYFNTDDNDKDLDIEEAWDIATGGLTSRGDTIVVAVIDGGVNYEHEDLVDNMWLNHAEIPDNNIDDDNNGYVDDYRGWSAYSNDDVINSSTYHGTEVAGIVGAKGNNGVGVSGISWDVKVMFIQGGGNEAAVLEAYAYPYIMRKRYNDTDGAEGAFIVSANSSWGTNFGKAEDAPLWCDFYNQMGEEGIVSCAATANLDINVEVEGDLPTTCSSDYLISVTNITREDKKAFAGYGKYSIDLGAYGSETYTVNYIAGYGEFGGTSGATPHVAGTIGLLYSAPCSYLADLAHSDPAQAALAAKDFILNGVVSNEDLKDVTTSGGKLNIANSMRLAMSPCDQVCAPVYGVEYEHSGIYAEELTFASAENSTTSLRYRKEGETEWSYRDNIVTPFLLDDLSNCTLYEIQFGTVCDTTTYQYSRYIKTDGCCEIPTIEGHTTENGQNTVLWSTGSITDEVTVEYKVQDGTWQSTKVTGENRFTLPVELDDCSYVEVKLQGYCGLTDVTTSLGESYFIYSDCGSCQEDYCDFSGMDNNGEYLSKIEIENVFTRISDAAENAYEFILDESIIITDNNAYTVNAEVTYGGSEYAENIALFIDLNYDGIFQSEERLLYVEGFQSSTSETFEIPEIDNFGSTRMRVALLFDPIAGGCRSSDQRFGEVEDYCIELRSHLSCPTYADLTMNEGVYSEEKNAYVITTEDEFTTTFTVDVNGVADSYGVELKLDGTTEFITYSSAETTVSASIQRCSNYDIRAFAQCGDEKIYSGIYKAEVNCGSSSNDLIISDLNLYPNPGISFKIDSEKEVDQVDIYSTAGKLMATYNKVIDHYGSELPMGMYIVVVSSDGKKRAIKWLHNM